MGDAASNFQPTKYWDLLPAEDICCQRLPTLLGLPISTVLSLATAAPVAYILGAPITIIKERDRDTLQFSITDEAMLHFTLMGEWPEKPLEYVARNVWGAEEPRGGRPLSSPVKHIFIKYDTDTPECRYPEQCMAVVKELQEKAVTEGFSDIKQNFLIGGDGYVYEGRGWVQKPPVSKRFPNLTKRIDIGYLGSKKVYHFRYDIMKLGLDIIYYGVVNNHIRRPYKVKEWRKHGSLEYTWEHDTPEINMPLLKKVREVVRSNPGMSWEEVERRVKHLYTDWSEADSEVVNYIRSL